MSGLSKGLPTNLAGVNLLVLVLHPEMDVEAGFLRKRQATFFAPVRPDAGVGVAVRLQMLHPTEGFTTFGTEESSRGILSGFLILMDALDVSEHALLGNESYRTEMAAECLHLILWDIVFSGHVIYETSQGSGFHFTLFTLHAIGV